MLVIDHIGIAARDAYASAKRLADLLGAPEPVADGADDDMFRVDLDDGICLLFSDAETVNIEHIAFRVDQQRFEGVLSRLREFAVPFGNDPAETSNGRTDDFLGGVGRIYFEDDNGHLFEVVCPA
jgi:catechol 2,3-dioxygenase-like lactoylglutathione lyase family enzyme